MKALLVCENLMKALTDGEITHGRVHSVFDGACNIETEMGLVTLLSKDKAIGPMSAVMEDRDGPVNFKELCIVPGMHVNFSPDGIRCSELNIFAGLSEARVWFPGITAGDFSGCPGERLLENLEKLEQALEAYVLRSGIGPFISILVEAVPGCFRAIGRETGYNVELNRDDGLAVTSGKAAISEKGTTSGKGPTCGEAATSGKGIASGEATTSGIVGPVNHIKFVMDPFICFIKAAAAGDIEKAAEASGGIIGYGPGLTPSIDDFICGMMLAFLYMGHYYGLDVARIIELNRSIAGRGPGRTTRISCEMLRHSAEGNANLVMKELILSILGGLDTRNGYGSWNGINTRAVDKYGSSRITRALERAAGIGATSGADMAFGVYTGCRIMTNSKYRGGYSYEDMRGCKEKQLLRFGSPDACVKGA